MIVVGDENDGVGVGVGVGVGDSGTVDGGHEAVGQALLVTAVAVGTLSAVGLGGFVVRSLTALMEALG